MRPIDECSIHGFRAECRRDRNGDFYRMAANHQVVVNVDANSSYAADLSTLTDGTITSSLAATSPTGNTTSATGNTVTLDTDRDLTPTVSVNALDPAHVTFTISELEGDEVRNHDLHGHQRQAGRGGCRV